MLVSDLIKLLQDFPQDAIVQVWNEDPDASWASRYKPMTNLSIGYDSRTNTVDIG